MDAINQIIQQIACRLEEVLNITDPKLGLRAYQGLRDGSPFYYDSNQEEVIFSDTSLLFAFHLVRNIKQLPPQKQDSWNVPSVSRPQEIGIDARCSFVIMGQTGISPESLYLMLKAFNTTYTAQGTSAQITFQDYTDNLPAIVQSVWGKKAFDRFQHQQMILKGAKVEYSIQMQSCTIC